jgi:steroid delta-isomerase-like uncharacterized protein
MKGVTINKVLKGWLEVWPSHDAPALAAVFAKDAVYTSMLAGAICGRKAVEALYRDWFTAFPDMQFQVDSQLIHKDRAAILWSQTGTHTGEFCGLSGTGRIFVLPGSFFMTFKDGQIVHMRSIYDFSGLLLQLGLLRAKPAV